MTVRGSVELQRRLGAIADTRSLMRTLGLQTVGEAKRRVARKTGNTGRSIRLASSDHDSARITVGGAGAFLEKGPRPHIIRARRARALRFAVTSRGQRLSGSPRRGAPVAFARSVRHPGTKPQPFAVPAAKHVLERSGIPKRHIVTRWDSAA